MVVFASVTNRYDYDALGQRVAGTDGLGNATVYAYDEAGRLLSTTDPAGFATTCAYDAAGRLSVIGIPGSTVTYVYTPDSLDAGYSVLTPSNAVLTRTLTRDPQRRGLILSVSNLLIIGGIRNENLMKLAGSFQTAI